MSLETTLSPYPTPNRSVDRLVVGSPPKSVRFDPSPTTYYTYSVTDYDRTSDYPPDWVTIHPEAMTRFNCDFDLRWTNGQPQL
ncbi:hypothetical protein IWQ60_008468 [Tieghemiomyces parasiticus]|uniref:Uncharacterized protein n=1 Tax=Tieghemiomyces parasiticus TaxID=78921 RepID=A0A9W7ZIV0_9FUNG|nr:hypothetical protein IWQ60_011838 [Tieghemiomyces parasiticus]KAJ1915343.1 hypothetical protein IWQ60_008468 [Tieghemiomyces parasiticus]